jgi:hypothetical protein
MASDRFSTPTAAALHIRDMPKLEISDVARIEQPAIYRVGLINTKVSTAFYPKVRSDALNVFFSGFVNRKALALPVFRRWEWNGQAPGHALYISDPTLEACDDLGLGWYIGDRQHDCMEDIACLVRGVARTFGVSERKIVFYGSSGGGFAALRALRWFPQAAAITINPQTRLTAFRALSLTNYLARFFGGISKDAFAQSYPTRNAVVEALAECREACVVYVQNSLDEHHFAGHLSEIYQQREGVWTSTFLRNQELILFEDPQGHDTAEPKSLMPRLFATADQLQARRFG